MLTKTYSPVFMHDKILGNGGYFAHVEGFAPSHPASLQHFSLDILPPATTIQSKNPNISTDIIIKKLFSF
jgi:hypothetical protein